MADDCGAQPEINRRLEQLFRELIVGLEKKVDTGFISQERVFAAYLESTKAALLKAETNLETRFDAQKDLVRDIESSMDRRFETARLSVANLSDKLQDEYDAKIAIVQAQLAALINTTAQRDAKSIGIHAGWGYVVGVVGFVISLVTVAWSLIPTHPTLTP